MCFYDDPDWYASVVEDETIPAVKPVKCDECRRVIPVGAPVRHIFMQQHEVCRNNPQSDDYEGEESDSDECPEDCECDYGETFSCNQCETCVQLIEAIHVHEIEAGCRDDESRPPLTGLYDAMAEGEGAAYLATAERLYPGITWRLSGSFVTAAGRHGEDQ